MNNSSDNKIYDEIIYECNTSSKIYYISSLRIDYSSPKKLF